MHCSGMIQSPDYILTARFRDKIWGVWVRGNALGEKLTERRRRPQKLTYAYVCFRWSDEVFSGVLVRLWCTRINDGT